MKLNLGSGNNKVPGYINVDKYGAPDVVCDLESTPWPWDESSVCEVRMVHVLEHLGRDTEVFLNIIKELYRVCAHKASIHIVVPHPRHDNFLNDPTHVRIITPNVLGLFSRKENERFKKTGSADSPLAEYLNVDFRIVRAQAILAEPWLTSLKTGTMQNKEIQQAIRNHNNVVETFDIELEAVKT